jgi:hypothetical protein
LSREEFVEVTARTGGIQAQVMSAAELAIGARVNGITQPDVQAALWQERSIIKIWAMRATLHLITASDYPLYVAARSLSNNRPWARYFADNGVNTAQYKAYLAAAPEILGDEPLTRDQLARALAEHTRAPELQDMILTHNWGTPLKILAWRGDLCFGPSDGRNVTFVNPRKWIGGLQPVDPDEALQELARRYLRAYGPGTVEQFAQWWELRLIPARKLFQSLEEELEPVDVEGWKAFALRETLEPMLNSEQAGSVCLLPLFDAYVVGIGRGDDIQTLLSKPYQRLVYRTQGWISAVVLEDGYMKGTWKYETKRSLFTVRVNLFTPLTVPLRKGIEAEVERLAVFLNTKVDLKYTDQ